MTSVLLAEDTAIGRAIAQAMLEALGYQVTAVQDGPAAVAAARTTPFECALLDLQLPGLDGLYVARAIRNDCKLAERPTPRIIAMTATRPDWMDAELAAGTFEAFLEKPLRPGPLRIALGLESFDLS